jgi:hypothetical protein
VSSTGSATIGLARRHPLLLIAALGLAARVALAFAFFGSADVGVFQFFGAGFNSDPLHVYRLNVALPFPFPYPPVFLPWAGLASTLSSATGLPYHGVVQLLPILADLALAGAVHAYLGTRGATDRTRVAGFALIMLGPVFIAISGYHGQLDSVAILPGVLALIAWERPPPGSRAGISGALIGLGAATKTVPALLLLPLLAAARSWGQAFRLVALAALVVAAITLPFLIAEPAGFKPLVDYQGLPGKGGLSLVVDPGFAADSRTSAPFEEREPLNRLGRGLSNNAGEITILALLALAAFLFRYRPAPIDGTVLLWLTVFAVGANFFIQYMVWAIPFFIMAGYLRETAILQLALVPAIVLTYLDDTVVSAEAAVVFVISMACLWAFWVVALAVVATRVVHGRREHPEGIQPPLIGWRAGAAEAAPPGP